MSKRADLLYSSYRHFTDQVLDAIRKETFGVDIGQNSWLTVEEYDRFLGWLELTAAHHVLEIASGSGGPSLHLARSIGCRVTGVDADEGAVATASRAAEESGMAGRVAFRVANANERLPFEANTFDGVVCMDSMNHLADRLAVLAEWRRVLRPGRRAVFTDPVVITGAVSHDELALRSSVGFFLFVPPGVNEQLIERAGLRLLRVEDASENAALVSGRWHRARQAHRDELVKLEGEERFEGLQRFFDSVHTLTGQRRLSRFAYLAEKPAGPDGAARDETAP